MPSLLPVGLAPLYTRSGTTYNRATGTTIVRVQITVALEMPHELLSIVRSPVPTTAEQVSRRLFALVHRCALSLRA